ncbi:EAL domain-containing protein [Fulvimarina sp. 2208YS6-2-32]|uniref:EAL domain-containing protein n=1 Tax=Fulvimarina uroteuthidis TaxID=3098149 RepID=A0ABU5I468_9HYPH|nr:EAL domain-containing protein [Fulvimarina sp. 2208YS6-2-32]MDY8110174.1 EAL domain-containing protein [Fulvimarina sp. 2208YS6-2-32]
MENLYSTIDVLASANTDDVDVMQEALTAIRNHLGMEVAYISEFVEGRAHFRRVDAPGLEHLIKVGDSQSLDDVYCNHILAGRLPQLIPDTSKEPLAESLPITRAVPIGSHVSIPIHLANGAPYGMFCCLSPRAIPTLNERDLETMRVFGGIAAKQVNKEIEELRATRSSRAGTESVLLEKDYQVVFQPIVNLLTMEMSAVEALTRFGPQPYRSPDKWFQDAFDSGLGIELELAVIRSAVEAFSLLPNDVDMSVNASPQTIVSGRLAEVLDGKQLHRTILELTEHAHVADYALLHSALAPLRKAGVKIAIDDAGAGYSGLQHIVQIAPDIIKLDMSLIRSIDAHQARRALTTAMIYFARETGASVVAEGIETSAELKVLQTLGVNKGQGYLLGKPGPLPAYVSPVEFADELMSA